MNVIAISLMVLAGASQLALIVLVFLSARWLHRRVSLVSGYWVGVWLVLTTLHGIANPFVRRVLEGGEPTRLDVDTVALLAGLAGFLQQLGLFALFLLVMAEVLDLARRAADTGGAHGLVERLANLSKWRHALGVASVVLLLAGVVTHWALTASVYGG